MSRSHPTAGSRRCVRKLVQAVVASVPLLGMAGSADAQVATWTFAGGGNWNSPSNWSPVGVPNGSTIDVVIDDRPGLDVSVNLNMDATVNTLRLDAGDQLFLNASRRLVVGGATVDGIVTLGMRAELALAGMIANAGSIVLTPGTASGDTFIDLLPAGATLTGGGTITVVNGSAFGAITAGGTVTLANQTIQGRGQVGWNRIGIVNQAAGLIRANVAGQGLLVDPGTLGLINEGTMSAVDGGVLQLSGNGGGAYNNAGGVIRAETGSEVQLIGVELAGGTLSTVGTGVVRTTSGADSFFTNATLNGNMVLASRGDLGLTGTFTNTGNVLFTSGNATSDTLIDVQPAGATLTGGGSITMVAGSSILGTTAGGTLTIADHTIEGRGQVGRNSIAIVNQAGSAIRSNVSGQTLFIDPGAGGLTNQGLIEAANDARIQMTGNGGGSFNNAGGVIRAANGTEIQFTSGAEIIGGTLESIGTGLFRTTSSVNTIFDNLTIDGYVTTTSRGDITLRGAIHNTGTIQINPGNATSDTILELEAAGAALTGGGAIFLNGNTSTQFRGAMNAPLAIVDQTIRGGGWLGSGQLVIDNQADGILHADTAGGVLLVDVAGPNAFTNAGLLQATNGGTLRFNDSFTNEGTIHAGPSSLVDVNTIFTNGVDGTIRGTGTFEVSSLLTNNGRISPGGLAGNAAGTLAVSLPSSGTLAFGATGVLEIELAGVSAFDALVISGRATLDGQLAVRLLDGYLPGAADTFTILTSTNPLLGPPLLGAFANAANGATIRSADNRATFTVGYFGNNQVKLSNFAIVGDFNNNGALDAGDIDQLLRAASGAVPPALAQFDVNFDGSVAAAPGDAASDSAYWVTYLKGTAFGDADLNGAVNFDDLLVIAQNYGNSDPALGWSAGNFDGTGGVDFADLLLLAQHYGAGTADVSPASFAADWDVARSLVPEPAAVVIVAGGLLVSRRRR